MFSSNVHLGYVLEKNQKVYSTHTSLVPGIIDFCLVWTPVWIQVWRQSRLNHRCDIPSAKSVSL